MVSVVEITNETAKATPVVCGGYQNFRLTMTIRISSKSKYGCLRISVEPVGYAIESLTNIGILEAYFQ